MALFTGHTITPDSALGGVQIQRSLRFNSGDSQYITRSCTSEGNRVKWTWSGWVKKTRVGRTSYALLSSDNGGDGGGNNGIASIYFHSSDAIHTYYDTTSGDNYGAINSNVYRDTNSWYHIVWQVDAANQTSKIWVNGVEQSIASGSQPIGGYNYTMNQSGKHMSIGVDAWDVYTYSDTYIAETHYSDGQLYAASDFGYTDAQTGQWRPKNGNEIKSNITYGTNGFWLDFRDATSTTTLGYDYSGNANHWTLVNMSVTNNYNVCFTSDTPTNNFPTINTLSAYSTNFVDPTNGGLNFSLANNYFAISSIEIPTSGKWYAECVFTALESGDFGVFNPNMLQDDSNGFDGRWNGIRMPNDGTIRVDNTSVQSSLTSTANNNIIGILIDRDAGTVSFTINGSANGTPVLISSMTDSSALAIRAGRNSSGGSNPVGSINFGQRPFSHLPTGYRSLSSKNRATPSPAGVVRPKRHFDTVLYTGNGSTQSVSGLEFKPDFVWIKERSSTSESKMFDVVRGVQKGLSSSSSGAEEDQSNYLTSFHDHGFVVGNDGAVNENSQTYVAWCWKAGGAAVTNNDGSITTQVSANQEAGFSIVTYTGNGTNNATIGHGLGKAPAMRFGKARELGSVGSAGPHWTWNHQLLTNGMSGGSSAGTVFLNLTQAEENNNHGAIGAVSSTTATLSDGSSGSVPRAHVNESSATYVQYFWAEIPGFSKFGEYTANGSADGLYAYCGFRPAFIMIRKQQGEDTVIYDIKRDTTNVVGKAGRLYASLSNAQSSTTDDLDILSDGFKIRKFTGIINGSSGEYIFMAFAEQPIGTMFGLDANAR